MNPTPNAQGVRRYDEATIRESISHLSSPTQRESCLIRQIAALQAQVERLERQRNEALAFKQHILDEVKKRQADGSYCSADSELVGDMLYFALERVKREKAALERANAELKARLAKYEAEP